MISGMRLLPLDVPAALVCDVIAWDATHTFAITASSIGIPTRRVTLLGQSAHLTFGPPPLATAMTPHLTVSAQLFKSSL